MTGGLIGTPSSDDESDKPTAPKLSDFTGGLFGKKKKPKPESSAPSTTTEKLLALAKKMKAGEISAEEFETEKKKLL